MGQAIGDVLPMAVGVAISPIPIIAVILMLFTGRARQNGLAFLVGWILGVLLAGTILILIAQSQDLSSAGQPSDTSSWIKLILGVLLLLGAIRQWRARPAPGVEPVMPKWMQKVDTMKPGAAFGLAVLLSAVNPKNLLLIAAAAAAIAEENLSSADTVVVYGVFTLIASCTVAIPVLGYLFLGAKAQPALDRTKAWLIANSTAVMAVLLLVIGVTLLGDGISGLSG